jgi:leucyl/phenylalanyl-tRNA---protein transferase
MRFEVVPPVLAERLWFPDPGQAPRSGLVAVGGGLSVPRLLLAYRNGIFPWTDAPVTWWSPDPRAVIKLDPLHLPRSLNKVLRKGLFRVTTDQAFRAVIESCAQPAPGRLESWITPAFIEAYTRLHEAGHAHSVECWQGATLAGGVYGVAIGGFFAGESMFHHSSNASKVALWHLLRHLQSRGFALFDIQMLTPVTRQFGATTMARADFLKTLASAVALPVSF